MKKETVVIHSGGMDSSICLKLAIDRYSPSQVLSLSFQWGQRHQPELEKARFIAAEWGVDHKVIAIDFLSDITQNALLQHDIPIEHPEGGLPNTLVMGRNGLMARLGAIYAHHLGVRSIYMGVIGVEESNCGYRDCSRAYMDLKQQILRIDLGDPEFEILTPLVHMTKHESLELADERGVLDFLLENTITCYEGIPHWGCSYCPACLLRNAGVLSFYKTRPDTRPSWVVV